MNVELVFFLSLLASRLSFLGSRLSLLGSRFSRLSIQNSELFIHHLIAIGAEMQLSGMPKASVKAKAFFLTSQQS